MAPTAHMEDPVKGLALSGQKAYHPSHYFKPVFPSLVKPVGNRYCDGTKIALLSCTMYLCLGRPLRDKGLDQRFSTCGLQPL